VGLVSKHEVLRALQKMILIAQLRNLIQLHHVLQEDALILQLGLKAIGVNVLLLVGLVSKHEVLPVLQILILIVQLQNLLQLNHVLEGVALPHPLLIIKTLVDMVKWVMVVLQTPGRMKRMMEKYIYYLNITLTNGILLWVIFVNQVIMYFGTEIGDLIVVNVLESSPEKMIQIDVVELDMLVRQGTHIIVVVKKADIETNMVYVLR